MNCSRNDYTDNSILLFEKFFRNTSIMKWTGKKSLETVVQWLVVLCCMQTANLAIGFQQQQSVTVSVSKIHSLFFHVNHALSSNHYSKNMGLKMAVDRQNNRREPIANPPINQFIKAATVRLIAPSPQQAESAEDDEDDVDGDDVDEIEEGAESNGGEMNLGVIPIEEALRRAAELDLDLVMINEKSDPPICKILDYGKFKYSVDKKKKENLKKQAKSDIKEVKLSYKIDQHDFDVRLRAIQKFIADGDRVRFTHLATTL